MFISLKIYFCIYICISNTKIKIEKSFYFYQSVKTKNNKNNDTNSNKSI